MSNAANPIDQSRRKGRGANSNDPGRFDIAREPFHDGWDMEEELPPLRTQVSEEQPKTIIARNSSPDIPFDRSINMYRGCEHGCIYCYARPSHAYLGLSPGLDFETRLIAKPTAPALLVEELRKRRYKVQPLAIGTNTDAYQPIERDRRLMRQVLEVLRDFRHPVTITTKGSLIERDLDILAPMAADGLVQVGIGVTSLDRDLARRMEPRVPSPERRLAVIKRLSEAGVPVRVMVSPIVPGLTDHEIEAILQAGQAAGARAASYITLRLPLEVSPLFRDWLAEHYPLRASRVMGQIRDMQGGQDYDPAWGKRMQGQGVFATMIRRRFELACARLGLARELPALRSDLFRVPPRAGDQLSLF